MLYPHNTDETLSKELFQNPGSEYRGAPFWAWNCKLEKEELLRQLDVLKQMGLGGAHMHVRTGMATPYLSDEHMELIKACVDKCRDEKMLAWLYDEDRWPSGAAGGLLTKEMQYRARHLLMTPIPYGQSTNVNLNPHEETLRSENGYLLACYDVVLDENGCLSKAEKIDENAQAEGRKWYAYVETNLPSPWFNNQTYPNTLDKATMQRFIEITYERYLETVGEDFGGVVPAIFTDEPQFAHKQTLGFAEDASDVILPWSDDLGDTFREAYGEDLIAHLPELFWELPDGRASVIRYHYHDHIAERFAQAFADQCGKWCSEHGLMLTGHMMEEPTLKSQTAALGEAMRSYRSFQLPGIDMLCSRFEFSTAKQTQSAVHQYGREGMLSELYGVTGWAFDFRGHKLHGDWQAALGVTVRVPHLSWVSMKGEAKRDYPASINYQSPWWQDYSYIENHFARVNAALTRGKPLVKVGVIHPVESYWLHWGPAEQTYGVREQLDAHFGNVIHWLLNGSIDFDFICESLLPGLCETASAPMKVGQMAYDAIVVPGCETLRSTTLERLEAFQKAGGKLIFLGDAPTLADAMPSERGKELFEKSKHISFSCEALLSALQDERMVDIRNADGSRTGNLVHQLRRDTDGLWLFVAHGCEPYSKDIPVGQDVRITVSGAYQAQIWDTQTGEVHPANAKIKNGKTVITATLYDYDSLLVKLKDSGENACFAQEAAKPAQRLVIPDLVNYVLDEPNALLLDKAEFALDDEPFQPRQELLRADNVLRNKLGWPTRECSVAQPWTVKEENAEHVVRLRFTVISRIETDVKLALEDADDAQITLNGRAVTARPDGWFVDKSIGTVDVGRLSIGENIIDVVLPFGLRTNVEWCYVLGDFGVTISGEHREIVGRAEKLGFSDVTSQTLPHYTGNIRYDIPFASNGGEIRLTIPHYSGAAVRVTVDDENKGYVVYPPYALSLGKLPKGDHMLSITLLGNRENAFGPVHRANLVDTWIGPNAWRTVGAAWSESYWLTRNGIRTAPWLEEIEE